MKDAAGIVTASDSNYFPGLEQLTRSIQESWPVPIVCFDIGLTPEQKARAADKYHSLRILPVPEDPAIEKIKSTLGNAAPLAKANKRIWPLWICPFLISAAPFQRTFWLDSDILVLRNLQSLFALLDDGPVFTPENNAPEVTANKPALYELLPIKRSFDPLRPAVNAGVSGWDLVRDEALLAAYKFPILRACEDDRIRDAISWHDQGALIWAIQKMGLEHRVLESRAWNLCVRNTSVLAKNFAWNEQFLDKVRQAIEDANLLHWNGVKVPWAE